MNSAGKKIGLGLGFYLAALLMATSSVTVTSFQAKAELTGGFTSDSSISLATARKPKPRKPANPVVGLPGDSVQETPIQGGSVSLDTCFSPGNCDQKLIGLINKAQHTLDVAIYSLTHTGIAQAIIDAKSRGVQVRVVVDRSQSRGKSSQVSSLQEAGIDLKIGNFRGIMHDKYTIVDAIEMETGSFNYSENATSNNGENQLYLNDLGVIQRYEDNFSAMYADGLKK